MQQWLKSKGVSAAVPTISEFLERAREQRLQKDLLNQITSGGRQVQDVEKAFSHNSAPQTETLIKLVRVLILHLTTSGRVDLDLLKQVAPLMKIALECDNRAYFRKSAQQQALEMCLEEAKSSPEIAALFQQAFAALEKTKASTQAKDGSMVA